MTATFTYLRDTQMPIQSKLSPHIAYLNEHDMFSYKHDSIRSEFEDTLHSHEPGWYFYTPDESIYGPYDTETKAMLELSRWCDHEREMA